MTLVLSLPTTITGHDVPATATVLAFVKPEGTKLHFLVRVPLQSMRDIEIPQRGPGFLDIALVEPELRHAAQLWIAEYLLLYETDTQLPSPRVVAARISLPSDRSFGSYETGLAHVQAPPLPQSTELPWQQAMLDVLLEYQIGSDRSQFAVRPALGHLGVRTTTVLRFLTPDGTERAFQYAGNPGLVRLDPRWHQAARSFVKLGFHHILGGIDHLLFVFCLVIPFRQVRPLVVIVTSFTIAHSITLIASAMGFAPDALWFPPFIEVLIAISIVYMAFENIVGARLKRRWLIAFAFGLVHGFGFSFALRESLQFAGSHLLTSLLAFNLGVELGQLLVLALAIPLLAALFRYVLTERIGTILLSALVAHTAWHWLTERWGALRAYDIRWPAFDLAFAANVMRGLMVLLILSGVAWLLSGVFSRLGGPVRESDGAGAAKGQRLA